MFLQNLRPAGAGSLSRFLSTTTAPPPPVTTAPAAPPTASSHELHIVHHSAAAQEDDDKEKKRDDEKGQKDDETDNDEKKGKKAKKAEEDDDTDEKGSDDSDRKDERDDKARAARARERGRIQAIMSLPAAQANPDIAWPIALSDYSRGKAIALINAIAAGRQPAPSAGPERESLRDRMAAVPIANNVGPGSSGGDGQMSVADFVIMAGKKARGEIK